MVIVFDTNVLLSALFFKSGISSALLNHTLVTHDLVISDCTLDEFSAKLNSPDFRKKNRNYRFDEATIQQLTAFVRRHSGSLHRPTRSQPVAATPTITMFSNSPNSSGPITSSRATKIYWC